MKIPSDLNRAVPKLVAVSVVAFLFLAQGLTAVQSQSPKGKKESVNKPAPAAQPANTGAAPASATTATPAKPAPKPVGPLSRVPTKAIGQTEQMYNDGQYAEAALAADQIVTRQAGGPGNLQKAQFLLGKSLYQLKFYQSALAVFDEISQDKSHRYYKETLGWLGRCRRLSRSSGALCLCWRLRERDCRIPR